jgi:enamine deaminase RidA (YjgF/YER057c/UK114 family)|tara:strand:+ start:540 stop:998 length:459 start_codon:yes stop_codon:yes gene_type:complete
MIEKKLLELGIILPVPPKPAGSYIPVVISDQLAFVSGQIPVKDGQVVYQGKVASQQSIENAQNAAKLCIINGLSQLNSQFGTLENLEKIIKISGFVNSDDGFTDQPKVINPASDLLVDIFGDKGKHSRIAVGVSSLPLNATIEIDMIVEIKG